MTLEAESVGMESVDGGDVVAAVDEIDGQPHLVIADIAQEEVWLSMAERATVSLADWQ